MVVPFSLIHHLPCAWNEIRQFVSCNRCPYNIQLVPCGNEGNGESKDKISCDFASPYALIFGPSERKVLRNLLAFLVDHSKFKHKYMVIIMTCWASWTRRMKCACTHKSLLAQGRAGEKRHGHGCNFEGDEPCNVGSQLSCDITRNTAVAAD